MLATFATAMQVGVGIYKCTLLQETTVSEFISAVLQQRPDEWGGFRVRYSNGDETHIGFIKGKTARSYRRIANRKLNKHFKMVGGQRHMEYILTLEDQNDASV